MSVDVSTGDFLCAFFEPGDVVHLRAFPPRGAKGDAIKSESTPEALDGDDATRLRLVGLNASLGLYFVVNGGGDTDADITRYTAWFVERDEGTLTEQHAALDHAPVPPSIRVETRKSVHAYWLTEGLVGEDEWRDIQARLIAFFASDPVIKNPSRVMRLPGFDHITADGERKRVTVEVFDPKRRYTASAMRSSFPAVEPTRKAAEVLPFTAGQFPTWDALNAEARRRLVAAPTFKANRTADADGNLWGHCRALCHDGEGEKGLAVNITSGAYHCQRGCDTATVLRALGLPDRPVDTDAKPKAVVVAKDYPRPRYEPEAGRLPDKAARWLEERKLSRATLERNRVGAETRYFAELGREVLAVAFPYVRSGEVVNVKYRGPAKTWATIEAAERIFYAFDDVRPGEPLVVVAGEIDTLSVEEAGIQACIGAPSLPGERFNPREYDYLDAGVPLLESIPRVTIAVDATPAGDRLARELVRRFGPERCARAVWPDGCDDANDVLQQHGPSVLRECLDGARPIPVKGLWEPEQLSERYWAHYDRGLERGASPGWQNLAELYTVATGQWTVVTGVPGSGKSIVLDNIAVNLARLGWRFAVCSPETQPLEVHEARLASIWAEEPFFEGYRPRMSRRRAAEAERFLQEHFTFVLTEDGQTLDEVLELSRVEVARKGVRGVIVDPWNELEHTRPPGMSETEYVSQCLSRARRFARQYGVHLWIVAHPQKLYRNADGKYPVPTLYDISGSAHWANKADMALSVWRDKDAPGGATEVHVQKVRFKEYGRIGKAKLRYDAPTERFYDDVEGVEYGS